MGDPSLTLFQGLHLITSRLGKLYGHNQLKSRFQTQLLNKRVSKCSAYTEARLSLQQQVVHLTTSMANPIDDKEKKISEKLLPGQDVRWKLQRASHSLMLSIRPS